MRSTGVCKWWSEQKGYGFISPDDGSADVFCHFTSIRKTDEGKRNLQDGQSVSFEIERGPKGDAAIDVIPL